MNRRFPSSVVLLLVVSLVARADGEPPYAFIDAPMYEMPDLPRPNQVRVFPQEVIKLWLKALDRPESDYRYRAATTFTLAHGRGMKGLEVAVGPLRRELDRTDQHPNVRLAVARALVTLDAKEAAPSFFTQAKAGTTELREVLEPALAKWNHEPARAYWLERLRDPNTPHRPLVLAMRALGVVSEMKAADRLREISLAPGGTAATRVEAAKALGMLRPSGLEKEAEQLAKDVSRSALVERLVAAAFLSKHQSPEAVTLLQRLAGDPEPAVAAVAVARLMEIDEKLAFGVLEAILKSRDPKLRSLGVEILRRQPTDKHLRLLADRLDDEHPGVRQEARRGLLGLAKKSGLRTPILAEGMRILQSGRWQGLEQATLMLTELDHKPAAPRFLELIWEGRPEVFVNAAWGLRRLAVPDTLQGVLWYVTDEEVLLRGMRKLPNRADAGFELIDHQLSQLIQFLGLSKYKPAEKVLRRFVPRQGKANMPETRASAIWTLGILLEGKPDEALAKQLAARLDDIASMPPEDDRVRYMSAITIGRTKTKSELAMLRKYNQEGSFVHFACAWAIHQLTGEPMPKAKTGVLVDRGWFLKNVD